MTANELIGLIPKQVFREFGSETKVDHQVKKLTGEVMFKLILFSMLNPNKMSLRVMETLLQSSQFKAFCNHKEQPESRFTSIRDRISTQRSLLHRSLGEVYNFAASIIKFATLLTAQLYQTFFAIIKPCATINVIFNVFNNASPYRVIMNVISPLLPHRFCS